MGVAGAQLSQRSFAALIGRHSQTFNAVITGRRKLVVEMALKIEKALGYEEGFLLTLQAHYEIARYKNRIVSESVRAGSLPYLYNNLRDPVFHIFFDG